MRKAFFLSLLFGVLSHILVAQDIIVSHNNSLKTSRYAVKEAFPVVNELTNDVSLFLIDSRNIYAYLFDEQFQVKSSLASDKLPRKYKVLIGSSISTDGNYHLFLTNNSEEKFGRISFSYADGSSSMKEIDLNMKKQAFVQTISHNNRFYLITTQKDTSILNFYVFDGDGGPIQHKVDLSEERFINKKNKTENVYRLLFPYTSVNSTTGKVEKIQEDNPNSIETSSANNKLYLRDGKAVFTFDGNRNFTQMVSIDLNNFDHSVKRYRKPLEQVPFQQKKSNSFIQDQQLYMLASTREEFVFTISDVETGKLVEKYGATVNDTISFKNSPIIQEGGAYDSYREMEKTKKFLRKITSSEVGISVYKLDGQNQITLGGKKEIQGGSMMMPMGMGFPGVPIANFGTVNVFFNPTFFAYNHYSATKSTFIHCLFDDDFKHLEGTPKVNAFDKIQSFTEEIQGLKVETLFKHNDYFVFGHYSPKSKKYIFRKFTDTVSN